MSFKISQHTGQIIPDRCQDKGCIACYGGAWFGIYPPECNRITREKMQQNISDKPYRIEKCEHSGIQFPSKLSDDFRNGYREGFMEAKKEIHEKIARLFEEVRDIRELRYYNLQQIGCLEARVNDIDKKLIELGK